MAKHFSKKYGNKGWAFDYPVSAIWNKFLFSDDYEESQEFPFVGLRKGISSA